MFGLKTKCERKGHDWFPGVGPREFIPTSDICFRCKAKRTHLPWGQCLGGHPLADHYDMQGTLTKVPGCRTGGPC